MVTPRKIGNSKGPGGAKEMLDDFLNLDYEDETLDRMNQLDQCVLLRMVSEMYENIHGQYPGYMKNWHNDQLVDWFSHNYRYNPMTDVWQCVGITIH